MASPYAGVRILDFTQGIGGPMGCALMADFGADVVKIEPPAGDWAMDMPHYVVWNRNKRRITLDLTKAKDKKAALELIAKADIVVFDKHPGELEKIGLDAETLRKDHPELIHVWAPPYGTTGEWSDLPPDHMLLTALFGSAFRQASYAEQPVFLVTPLGFYGHGILLCSAMCTALFERARSGEGQAVIAAGLQGLQIFQNPAAGSDGATVPARQPLGTSVSYRVYECSDGKFLALGALFPHFFTRTLETLGFEDPASIPRAPESAPLLMKRFRERPRDEWIELFLKHDVPAAPVITRKDWFHSSIVASNNMRLTLDHPAHGKVTMPGTPVNFSTFEAGVRHLMNDAPVSDIDWAARQPAARNAQAPVDKGPLAGITILDLGTVIAGAYSTGILTGLGANVIKIEPEEGDPFRSMGAVWASYHRGKRGLGLDLKDPAGRELFLELVKKADVVLDNYRFGVRKRLGIDYEVLKEINPNIISCTINAYGANNEFTQTPGFDVVIQGHSGIMMAQGGEPDGEPIMNSMVINDVGSAAISSMGVLAALFAREATGRGMEVLTSMANVSLTVQAGEMAEYANRRPNIPGGRDLLGDEPLHHFYKCKDGRWVAVSAATEERFAALAKALGRADLTKTYAGRAIGADRDGPLTKDLAAIFAAISADEALAKLRAAGVPCAPTLRGPETFGDPYLWENDVFDNYFSPRHGDAFTGTPCLVHWGRSRSRNYERPSPDIGEHTEEVLREFGIDESRMADLATRRIIFSTS